MSDERTTRPVKWNGKLLHGAAVFFLLLTFMLCFFAGGVSWAEDERLEAIIHEDAESMLWYAVNAVPPEELRTCPVDLSLPEVSVSVKEARTRFSIDKTIEQLMRLPIDSYPATPSSYHGEIAGVTDAFIHLDHKIDYETVKDKRFNVGCLWFENVGVTLRLHSKIYIAGEYNKESCWYKEIFAHELKHIEADRAVMREYAKMIESGLGLMFTYKVDYVSGMTPLDHIDVRFYEMKRSLREGLGVLFKVMIAERDRRHQDIDKDNAYLDVIRKCGQPKFRERH